MFVEVFAMQDEAQCTDSFAASETFCQYNRSRCWVAEFEVRSIRLLAYAELVQLRLQIEFKSECENYTVYSEETI